MHNICSCSFEIHVKIVSSRKQDLKTKTSPALTGKNNGYPTKKQAGGERN